MSGAQDGAVEGTDRDLEATLYRDPEFSIPHTSSKAEAELEQPNQHR